MKTNKFCLIAILTVQVFTATSQYLSTKLPYMYPVSIDKICAFAKVEDKPILVYMHSLSCYESKRFSREVMNNARIIKLLRSKYICMNANVDSSYGNEMGHRYKLLLFPALVLLSKEGKLEYKCSLKVDTSYMLNQFSAFLTANNLKSEIVLFTKTSSVSFDKASKKIAAAYVASYIRDNNSQTMEEYLWEQTLGMGYFVSYIKSFKYEYEQKAKTLGGNPKPLFVH